MSRARHRAGARRLAAFVGVAIYALVLLATPILHHDFLCHLQSVGHCEACAANPVASGAEPEVGLIHAPIVWSGSVEILPVAVPEAPSFIRASGRAPPA
jgi:hypothetical protein